MFQRQNFKSISIN